MIKSSFIAFDRIEGQTQTHTYRKRESERETDRHRQTALHTILARQSGCQASNILYSFYFTKRGSEKTQTHTYTYTLTHTNIQIYTCTHK